nr:MAG TPA: hypothetical protein [Caudoviricetes sp.]
MRYNLLIDNYIYVKVKNSFYVYFLYNYYEKSRGKCEKVQKILI